MNGVIFKINQRRGMIAIKTENGDYSVFENTNGCDFEIGDKVNWIDVAGLGSQQVLNISKNRRCNVYFENHWISKSNLSNQLLEN